MGRKSYIHNAIKRYQNVPVIRVIMDPYRLAVVRGEGVRRDDHLFRRLFWPCRLTAERRQFPLVPGYFHRHGSGRCRYGGRRADGGHDGKAGRSHAAAACAGHAEGEAADGRGGREGVHGCGCRKGRRGRVALLRSWPGLGSVVVFVEAAISRVMRAGPRTFFDGANCGR